MAESETREYPPGSGQWATFRGETATEILENLGEPPSCPLCGGPATGLGQLGRSACYRCRNCGIDYRASSCWGQA